MTPDQLVAAISVNNQASPSANARIGDKNYLTPINTNIHTVKDFENIALFQGGVQSLFMRDVATVEDGADISVGYALVNGKRSIYLPIAKRAATPPHGTSCKKLKSRSPRDAGPVTAGCPSHLRLRPIGLRDQRGKKPLISEGAIGAFLTGLMVLLFLGDLRGASIVIMTIPTAIISGVLLLSLFGQTVNIMTLSGLSLAIGILVDESTVTIENIHRHLDMGKPKRLAIWDACREIAFPKLLILLCILAVFAPAFTMGGIPGSLFLPLTLAIGFSMIVSYFLAQTFVPVMANWILKVHPTAADGAQVPPKVGRFDKLRNRYLRFMNRMIPHRKPIVMGYFLITCSACLLLLSTIGTDVLPKVNGSQFQVRIRAPEGTRVERTEEKTIAVTRAITSILGNENVAITSAYVGQHPSLFSVNPIYLWMAGPQEAVLEVGLRPGFKTDLDALKERIRRRVSDSIPDVRLSFEPIELTDKILSQGSPTPIEVRFSGRDKKLNEMYAQKLIDKLNQISYLRDVQLGQSNKYPAINIEVDRIRAAQLGVDMDDIARSVVTSTSSSRYTEKNIWIDERTSNSYNVQVEVPVEQMNSIGELGEIPLHKNAVRPVLRDVATITPDTAYGEDDDLGALPVLSVTANLNNKDLGTAAKDVQLAIASLGTIPRGLPLS